MVKEKYFLDLLARDPKKAKDIIKSASNREISAVVEVIYNFLKGNIKTCCKTKKKLKKYAKLFRTIVTKITKKQRRKVLQTGGFIFTIAEILLPIAINYLSNRYFTNE